MKISLIADDFTGSNDTGVQFAKKGLATVVTTNIKVIPKNLKGNDVVVFDTESRFDSKDLAYQKAKDVALLLKESKVKYVYKKIDSTFRGNIGAEIAGAMDGLGLKYAILIPALPSNGRTTKDGHVLVNGKPVNQTEIANDPKTPVKQSYIPEIIGLQTKKQVYVIKKGAGYNFATVLDEINQAFNNGNNIVVLDAESVDDVKSLALLLPKVDVPFLMIGTAGLAEFIPLAFDMMPQQAILSIVGSVSDVTRKQIEFAAKTEALNIIDLSLEQLLNEALAPKIARQVIKSLANGKNTVIYTAKTRSEVELAQKIAQERGINNFEIADLIAERLGAITQIIFNKGAQHLKGVYITGGDTLIKISNRLKVSGMKVLAEVLPAIPLGNFIHPKYGNLKIVTKAGGFGNEETFLKILKYLGDSK